MARATPFYPPETIMQARALYLEGAPVGAIAAECAVPLATLYAWLDGAGGAYEKIPRRRAGIKLLRRAAPAPEARRAALVARLWRTAERQVAEIEGRLAALPGEPAHLERDAKTLAIIARMLRDLSGLDEKSPTDAEADLHDDMPRDIDEFRRELARRMDAFVAERAGG